MGEQMAFILGRHMLSAIEARFKGEVCPFRNAGAGK